MHLQGSDLLTSLLNLQPTGCTTGSNSSRHGKDAIHQRVSLCADTCAFSSMQVIVVYMRISYCYSLLWASTLPICYIIILFYLICMYI